MSQPQSDELKNFNVHLFPVVRVKVTGIKAVSHEDALKKLDNINLGTVFNSATKIDIGNGYEASEVDGADGNINHALVDLLLPDGSVDYDNTRWMNADGTPLIDNKTTIEFKAVRNDMAVKFYDELLSITETFTGIIEGYNEATLADVIYLQAAILKGTRIEAYLEPEFDQSRILDLLGSTCSCQRNSI